MSAATGRSLADAVDQNQKDHIDREVLGGSAGVSGIGAFATGRLRTSEHDGLTGSKTYSFATDEASAFANVVTTVPGTVLGGQLKLGAFAGHNWLSLDLKSNELRLLDPNQFGNAENESVIAGATALWASKAFYVHASIVGMWGETRMVDSVDDCGDPGCSVNRYRFDTQGFIGTVTAGKVFDLAGATGPKLDLRGTVGYTRSTADPFKMINNISAPNLNGTVQEYTFSTWTGKAAVTLFSNIAMQNNAVLRPFIHAHIRQEWDYQNVIEARLPDGTFERAAFDQHNLYGGLDAGVTYEQGNLTVGAAVYAEASGDERTLGGRLGASWKLGGDSTHRQSPQATPTPPFSWTGLYLGANAGFAWSDVIMTNLGPEEFFAPVGGSDTISPAGWIAGGQVGYNWHIGGIVVGVEASWSVPMLKDERVGTFIALSDRDHWMAEVSHLYAVTGRLGLASGNWLPYVKGGLAGAQVHTSMARPAEPNFISQSTNWHSGWTVGGGVEYMFARNWTVGLEYNYFNFESKDVSSVRTNDAGIDHWSVSPDNLQTLTARMNLKLN